MANRTVAEGDAVTMLCPVDGFPMPELTWILPDDTSTPHPLLISNVQRSDSGYYNCSAENTLRPSGLDEIMEFDSGVAYLDVTC